MEFFDFGPFDIYWLFVKQIDCFFSISIFDLENGTQKTYNCIKYNTLSFIWYYKIFSILRFCLHHGSFVGRLNSVNSCAVAGIFNFNEIEFHCCVFGVRWHSSR